MGNKITITAIKSDGVRKSFFYLAVALLFLPQPSFATDMSGKPYNRNTQQANSINPLQRLMNSASGGTTLNQGQGKSPLGNAMAASQNNNYNNSNVQGRNVSISYTAPSKSSMAYNNQYRPSLTISRLASVSPSPAPQAAPSVPSPAPSPTPVVPHYSAPVTPPVLDSAPVVRDSIPVVRQQAAPSPTPPAVVPSRPVVIMEAPAFVQAQSKPVSVD